MKTKILLILSVTLLSLTSNPIVSDARGKHAQTQANLDSSGIALEGYDPVSYFLQEGPQKGAPNISYKTKEGVTYHFQNEVNRLAFQKNPKQFEPAYGGWCAYAIAYSSEKVSVDPKTYLIQNGKLLLFYKDFFVNTRSLWLEKKEDWWQKAEKNWGNVN